MKKKLQFDYKVLIAVAVFLVTTAIMFWGQISGDSFFWEDFVEQVYPLQNYAAVESSSGIVPFWNPYTFSGMPFLADPQVGFYYPLNRAMDFFVHDGVLTSNALQLLIILHFFLAQLTMFLLIRSLKLNFAGALIGAIGYSFSMIFVCHVFHPMMIYHFAWFPLAFLFFKKALDKRKIYYALWSGLILAMMLLSGHPQTTLYLLLFLFLYFVWDLVANLWKKEFKKKNDIILYLGSAAVAVAIAAGIYMIQYMPSKEMFGYSVRQESTQKTSAEGSLEYKQLLQTFLPKVFGYINADNTQEAQFTLMTNDKEAPYYYYWDTAFYFGIGIFILGLIAIMAMWRQRMIGFLLFISIFGVLFALGSNFFIHGLFYNLPLFGTFRMPARIMIFAVFGFSILAAYGADYLSTMKVSKPAMKYLIISVAIPALFGILALTNILQGMLDTPAENIDFVSSQGMNTLIFSVLVFVCGYFMLKSKLTRTIPAFVLASVIFIDLLLVGGDFNKGKQSAEDAYALAPEQKAMFIPSDINNLFRVNTRIPKYGVMSMKRNQGMVDRIMMLEGYNPLNLKLRMPPAPTKSDVYDLMNTKFELLVDLQQQRVYYTEKNTRLPRFWLTGNCEVKSQNAIERTMKANEVDLHYTALLEENPNIGQNPPGPVKGNVRVKEYKSNHISLSVKNDRKAILIASEVWYPAWKVYIDGKETKMYRADYCLRGAVVPSGVHQVEFKYESSAYKAGSTIALITLCLTIISIILMSIKRKKIAKENKNA
ncbi:MAG: YfhO family protein [bacterium]